MRTCRMNAVNGQDNYRVGLGHEMCKRRRDGRLTTCVDRGVHLRA